MMFIVEVIWYLCASCSAFSSGVISVGCGVVVVFCSTSWSQTEEDESYEEIVDGLIELTISDE